MTAPAAYPLPEPSPRPRPIDGDRDNGWPGIVAPSSRLWTPSAQAIVASRAVYCRFVPSRPMKIHTISFVVTTAAGADDSCDVGIYDAALNLLGSAGSTSGKLNSAAVATLTLSADVTLSPRTVYYAAFAPGTFGSTAANLMCAQYQSKGERLPGSTAGLVDADFTNSSFALPSTLSTNGGGAHYPVLYLAEAS